MADFLSALGQFGQSLGPMGAADTQRRTLEHMQKVFAANPEYAKQLYGTLQGTSTDLPSDVRSYQFFSKLTPEQKREYLAQKRASQVLDQGGYQQVLNPEGGIYETYDKTLPPQDTPLVRGQQANAAEGGRIAATQTGESNKKAASTQSTLDTISEAKKILPEASSGGLQAGVTGTAKFFGKSTKSSKADARLKVLSAVLTQNVPRMEGPQSDRDTQMYKEAAANIGDNTLPYEDRQAALETAEAIANKYSELDTGNLPVPNNEIDAGNAALDVVKGAATKPPSIGKSKVLKYNPKTGNFD